MEGAAWLDAYFREPTALQELPVPALHHPVFLQGQYLGRRGASSRERPRWLSLTSQRVLWTGPTPYPSILCPGSKWPCC